MTAMLQGSLVLAGRGSFKLQAYDPSVDGFIVEIFSNPDGKTNLTTLGFTHTIKWSVSNMLTETGCHFVQLPDTTSDYQPARTRTVLRLAQSRLRDIVKSTEIYAKLADAIAQAVTVATDPER